MVTMRSSSISTHSQPLFVPGSSVGESRRGNMDTLTRFSLLFQHGDPLISVTRSTGNHPGRNEPCNVPGCPFCDPLGQGNRLQTKQSICDVCSNIFMEDSIYCRKCGTKRPVSPPRDGGHERTSSSMGRSQGRSKERSGGRGDPNLYSQSKSPVPPLRSLSPSPGRTVKSSWSHPQKPQEPEIKPYVSPTRRDEDANCSCSELEKERELVARLEGKLSQVTIIIY